MDIKPNLTLKKKRDLLGCVTRREMHLRKYMNNVKPKECRQDISQVTKCIFLGSLYLKPVPRLFDRLLPEGLDMKVGSVKNKKPDVQEETMVKQNTRCVSTAKKPLIKKKSDVCNQKIAKQNKSPVTSVKKQLIKKKCLNEQPNKIVKKKLLKEKLKLKPPIINISIEEARKIVKLEEANVTTNVKKEVTVQETSASGANEECLTLEEFYQNSVPVGIINRNITPELVNVRDIPEAEDIESPKKLTMLKKAEITPSESVKPTNEIIRETNKQAKTNCNTDLGEKALDLRIYTIEIGNPPEGHISELIASAHEQEVSRLDGYGPAELININKSPEIEINDSDDETIDQLMYNIMDIKIGNNVFVSEFYGAPPGMDDYRDEYEFHGEDEDDDDYEDISQSHSSQSGSVIQEVDGHKGRRGPQCKICSMKFTSYGKLKIHRIQHNGEKPYQCKQCGGAATSLDQLIAHLRTHKGQRPYVCKKCNQGFKSMKALESHQPVHVLRKVTTPKKIFQCETCSKEFKKLCDLDRHMRVHTGEKPAVCNICNKRFQQAHNLNKHLLIHTQEKPFQCDICSKRFGRNDVLNRHLLTHAIKKPNTCEICNKSFIRGLQLAQHKEKYHQNTITS